MSRIWCGRNRLAPDGTDGNATGSGESDESSAKSS